MPEVNFLAPPTGVTFMQSNAFGRMLAGPVGSGKTTVMIFELLRRAIEQSPGADGLRHTRFVIVRATLKQLKDTVIKDVQTWLGGLGIYRISESVFHLNFHDVRSEWVFLPLEDAEDQARLLSMQITSGWLSEAIEMDISVLAPLSARCGRYPSGAAGSPTWFGLIADTNMPPEGSPWHKFMTDQSPDWTVDIQPSGLSEQAENLANLPQTDATKFLPHDHPARIEQGRKYYDRLVRLHGIDSDFVKRYVKAEYGEDPSGTAVFRHCFNHGFHVVEDTLIVPGYVLLVGQDFGRDPWSVICQIDHLGRLVVHEEVAATEVGLETHVQRNLRPALLQQKYLGLRMAMVGDPAGRARSSISEESCFDALKRMGLPAFPAPTNDIDPRQRAVEALLMRQTNGGPTLMINKHKCPVLVRALNGGYRYGKNKAGVRKPTPEKNDYSHVADALQYACLVAHGGMMDFITSRLGPRKRKRPEKASALGWT